MFLGNAMKTNLKIIHQAGLTLLEVLVSLGILATVTTGIVALSNQQNEKTKASVVALHARLVGTAASEYIKDNYSLLLSTATATQPALIRVSDLVAAGKLQAGFNSLNARGQDTCVLVLKQSATNLTSILVTEGGETIDDLTLGQVASEIGAAGGGIYSTAPGNMRGSMGGWDTPIGSFANPNHLGQRCSGAGGNIVFAQGHPVMALWFADSQEVAATLYRDNIPGNPSLNTMNTPLLMGSVQTKNAGCTSVGAIARDANGAVLSCQGGIWKEQGAGSLYWKDPVSSFGALPASGDLWGTVRVTGDTARAYMFTGGGWAPLAVDQLGNLNVPGTLTMAGGRIIAANSASEGGFISIQGANGEKVFLQNLNGTFRLINSSWSGELMRIDQAGNMVMDQRGNGYGSVTPGWGVETWGCPQNGALARAAYDTTNGWANSGITLTCQAGIWRKQEKEIDILEGGHYISGLKPNKKYLVSVYGITAYRTNNDATLLPVQVRNSGGGIIGTTGGGVWINWHDGSAPQSGTMMIYAPADGVVYGYTDGGNAYYMTAIGG